ncbi:hypothetical protein DMS69_09825, partial [Klebsiella pneumoniae]
MLFHYQTLLNKIECRPDSNKAVGKINQKACHPLSFREGANKQVISSQADSLIKISRIWADF